MRFEFHLAEASVAGSDAAKVREQTRMALVCYGLVKLGHDAVIADVGQEFTASDRWKYFRGLQGKLPNAIQVVPAETLVSRNTPGRVVAFKNSASWPNDETILSRCELAVFHEYSPLVADNPKLLPVPFMVHTDVMSHFVDVGLFRAYMDDDLATIRYCYGCEKDIVAGFCGVGHYGRKPKAAMLPDWCEFILYDSPKFSPESYLRWISRCRVGFNMEGETPKSYRFSELTLMGVANAAPECVNKVTPPLTDKNSIVMRDWSDAEAVREGSERADEIVAEADKCYREGWSPMGQARLIAERMQ